MEKMRDIVIFVGAGLFIGAVWWHIYVQPHDEFNALVSDCMIQKDDRSMQSYKDCVSETNPQR
jgi:hypothetical protein